MRGAFVLVLLALFLTVVTCGCGGESARPAEGDQASCGTSTVGPAGQAETAACAANRRAITAAVQQYKAMEGRAPTSIQQLVPGYLESVPTCSSGGTYTLSGDRVTCSVHGS